MSRLRAQIAWTLVALIAAGCLSPGEPLLLHEDVQPPTVLQVKAGAVTFFPVEPGRPPLPTDVSFDIRFSETMDERTLLPGIGVSRSREEIEIAVGLPFAPGGNDIERGDVPYNVSARPTVPLVNGTLYTLVLRTLLLDTEGNALSNEIRIAFSTVP